MEIVIAGCDRSALKEVRTWFPEAEGEAQRRQHVIDKKVIKYGVLREAEPGKVRNMSSVYREGRLERRVKAKSSRTWCAVPSSGL